jgi:hypothetical protein
LKKKGKPAQPKQTANNPDKSTPRQGEIVPPTADALIDTEHPASTEDKRPFWKQWTFWNLSINVIAVVISLSVLGIYGCQLKVTSDALLVSRDQLRLSVRPWLALDDEIPIEVSPVRFDIHENARVDYSFSIKNFSSSAAQSIIQDGKLILTAGNMEPVRVAWDGACLADMVDSNPIAGTPGTVLMPGRVRVGQINHDSTIERSAFPKSPDGMYQAFFIVCVGYRDQFLHKYRTRYSYRPRTREGGGIRFKVSPGIVFDQPFMPYGSSIE